MFELYAAHNQVTVRRREPMTSGSVNVCQARFEFSEDWAGLARTAVFRAGLESRSVLLGEDGVCTIPWEVLRIPKYRLYAGVYGTRGGELVLPTVWGDLGMILPGAAPGEESRPPAPELWQQELAGKGDALSYTDDGDLGLWSGDRLLSSVPVSGGGEGGTSDHRALTHRDAARQHPINAIDGLEAQLQRIPQPVEALTNSELEELLK